MRKMLLILIPVLAAGCGGDESGTTALAATTPATPTAPAAPTTPPTTVRTAGDAGTAGLQAMSITGNMYALDGTYDGGCTDHGILYPTSPDAGDSRDLFSFSGTTYHEYELNYESTDGTCSGAVTENLPISMTGTATASTDVATIDGWLSWDLEPAESPLANDGAPIGDNAPYTPITINTGSRTEILTLVIDNTAGGPVTIYRNPCHPTLECFGIRTSESYAKVPD